MDQPSPTHLSVTEDDEGIWVELLPDDFTLTDWVFEMFRKRYPASVVIDGDLLEFHFRNGRAVYNFDSVSAPSQQAYSDFGQHYHARLLSWEPQSW